MPKSRSTRKGRKYQKKIQRKRRRQKAAQERDRKAEEVEAALQKDSEYIAWQQQQMELEEIQKLADERRRADEEEQWLRRELLAQREFRLERQRLADEEARQAAIREQQHKALEERAEAERKRREEQEERAAAAAAEFERTMQRLEAYLEDTTATEPPPELRCWKDTQPGQKTCEFFERTNCCRFGINCQYNHRLPLLSSILLIRNFYIHPLLRHSKHNEYMQADAMLELDERDIRADYDAFFEDVVPELEQFGPILNFRTVCNTLKHLSGNVFVEYKDERSSLKAFINLQGRYYATRRLNVEFAGLRTWRSAICGMCKSPKKARYRNKG